MALMTTNNCHPTKEAIRLTKLWQDHGPNTYPLDIKELIDGALDGSGFAGELKTKINTFDSFEGCLVRTKNTDKWTILLNSQIENERRLRFTYAHELGHFMCHRHLRDCFEDDAASLNNFKDEIELEANCFASWLLMPANIVREEFADIGWNTDTLREIGNRFECSLQATALRFVKLSQKPIAFAVSRDGMINWACKSDSSPFMTPFCPGDELPESTQGSGSDIGMFWNDVRPSRESQYFDTSGRGYQYTCIQFES